MAVLPRMKAGLIRQVMKMCSFAPLAKMANGVIVMTRGMIRTAAIIVMAVDMALTVMDLVEDSKKGDGKPFPFFMEINGRRNISLIQKRMKIHSRVDSMNEPAFPYGCETVLFDI